MAKKKYNYKDKLILITGGTSGIGLELAKIYANKCKYVAIIGRSSNNLSQDVINLLKNFVNIKFFEFDLKKLNDIPNLIFKIQKIFNQNIDVAICSAGYAVLGKVEEVPMEDYLDNFNVNFFSSVMITKQLIKHFKHKQSGQFIFINSGVGKRGLPGVSSYSSSKFALNGFCESLRVELHDFNIDVVVVSPGLVKSNFIKNKKLFGNLKNFFDGGVYKLPSYVAKKIYFAGLCRKRELNLSLKTQSAVFFAQNFPKIVDYFLLKKFNL